MKRAVNKSDIDEVAKVLNRDKLTINTKLGHLSAKGVFNSNDIKVLINRDYNMVFVGELEILTKGKGDEEHDMGRT